MEDYPEIAEVRMNGADGFNAGIAAMPQKDFKPWTNQLRPAGFVNLPEGAMVAVNGGYPVLFKTQTGEFVSPDSRMVSSYLAESSGLTIGSLYAGNDGAGIHLYLDHFFNTAASGEDAAEDKPVVIEVSVGAPDVFSLEIPEYSFSLQNPGWEPVEFIYKDEKNIIAWKYSDEKKSLFRYIIHSRDGESLDEIDENYFRDEYELIAADDGPFALRGFVRAVREGSAGEGLKDAGEIFIRLAAGCKSASESVYHAGAPGTAQTAAPVQLQACSDGDTWYILDDNTVFVCGSNIVSNQLPKLPDGFKYTGIWAGGGYMLLSWEESRFLYTARSGMIQIKMRDILK